jgi:hypothetical protein
MRDLPVYAALGPGVAVGAVLLGFLLRALGQARLAAQTKDKLGLVFATLLNPFLWLFITALALFTGYFLRNPPVGWWLWFVWGAVIGPPVLYAVWRISPGRRRILGRRMKRGDKNLV